MQDLLDIAGDKFYVSFPLLACAVTTLLLTFGSWCVPCVWRRSPLPCCSVCSRFPFVALPSARPLTLSTKVPHKHKPGGAILWRWWHRWWMGHGGCWGFAIDRYRGGPVRARHRGMGWSDQGLRFILWRRTHGRVRRDLHRHGRGALLRRRRDRWRLGDVYPLRPVCFCRCVASMPHQFHAADRCRCHRRGHG